MKTCSKCKAVKPLTEFNKSKAGKDGVRADCRLCTTAYCKEHYKKNSEKLRAKVALYYKENTEKERERDAIYRKENIEKIKEYQAKYYKANKEKANERTAAYYKENREELRAKAALYRKTKVGEQKERFAAFYKKNSERLSAKRKENIKNLNNLYVITGLRARTKLKASDIPQELIELKRVQLKLHRQLRGTKNGY